MVADNLVSARTKVIREGALKRSGLITEHDVLIHLGLLGEHRTDRDHLELARLRFESRQRELSSERVALGVRANIEVLTDAPEG